MQVGRIFLFQPAYAATDPASARAFWVGAARPGDRCFNRLDLACFGGSLLANTFNKAWCQALNDQRAGHDITHFGMLHDDICPEDGWANTLLEDLASSGADLVSCVVPIKNASGLTSTAIDDPRDGYLVERRLTMKEVAKLPDVFGSADCGYPERALLVNTGCWLCDFTKPWRFFVKFEIRERIVWCANGIRHLPENVVDPITGKIKPEFDDPRGQWSADVDPEDWNLSRQLHRLGVKVMATKRVSLTHTGKLPFANYAGSDGPWGEWDHDMVFADKFGGQPIDIERDRRHDDPYDVRGWLTSAEGRGLARLARGRTVLEIGSFCGRSTIWLAREAIKVTALDTFMGHGSLTQLASTFDEFNDNLKRFGVTDKVEALRMNSKDYSEFGNIYDVVFIDGDHTLDGVRNDIEKAYRVLKPGGFLAFHDYDNKTDLGVPTAVEELKANKAWRVVDKIGSIIVLQHVPQEGTNYYEIKEQPINGTCEAISDTTEPSATCTAIA